MEFERYYTDLFEMLNRSCKKIASGKYDQKDVDWLMGFTRVGRFPGLIADLAESFAMMMVKLEGREFRCNQLIEELQERNERLESRLQSKENDE